MSVHKQLYWPEFQDLARKVIGYGLHAWFTISCSGLEHFPQEGPVIIAPNHIRKTDSFLIGIYAERLHFGMGKEEYFMLPVMRHVLRWLGGFPVARPTKYVQLAKTYSPERIMRYLSSPKQFNYSEYVPKAVQHDFLQDMQQLLHKEKISALNDLSALTIAQYLLMKDETLIIHPEGTRHADGIIRDCKRGIAKIVLGLEMVYGKKVHIIPCAIAYGTCRKAAITFGEALAAAPSVSEITHTLEKTLQYLYQQSLKKI